MLGLAGSYLAAAGLGYVLGSFSVPAFPPRAGGGPAASSARVGFALRNEPHAPPTAWAALSPDVHAVRSSLPSPGREIFDLVVAVRGLINDGNSDWASAEQLCRALSWPRCDQASLEQLKAQSRP